MTVSVRQAGALFAASNIRIKVGGLLKTVISGRVMVADALKTFYAVSSELSLAVSPDSRLAVGFTATATSAAFTATPTGGIAPYSYAWSIVSYEGALPTALNPSFASSGFRQTGLGIGDSNLCAIRCDVTDSIGTTAFDTAQVTFTRDSM